MDQVFIILDKMDKIGFEGVERELLESGYAGTSVSQYMELLRGVAKDADGVRRLGGQVVDRNHLPRGVQGDHDPEDPLHRGSVHGGEAVDVFAQDGVPPVSPLVMGPTPTLAMGPDHRPWVWR